MLLLLTVTSEPAEGSPRLFIFLFFFQTVNDLKSRITIYALVWFGQPFGWLDEEKKHNITLKALQLSLINCLYELI